MGHITDRTYTIVNISGLTQVDFSQVMETSSQTVRKSLDNTMFVIKFEHDIPQTIIDLDDLGYLITINGNKYHTHSEILTILSGTEWTDPNYV